MRAVRSPRRVVVTGLGMVTPLGLDVATTWDGVLHGRSGIGPIAHFDAGQHTTRFAGTIQPLGFDAGTVMNAKEARRVDPFIHYGVAAAKQALASSGLEVTDANRDRIGVLLGSGIGGIGTIEQECAKYQNGGPRKVSPFFVPGAIINMLTGVVSMELNLTGPNLACVSACTTSAHALGLAARLIAMGDADAFLAGGAEQGCTPMGMAGFGQARALSTRNDNPQAASRPFDAGRDGFVLSDGAGVVVLEERAQALARGATVYAELVGFGMSGDAYHMTLPPDDGNGARRSMERALADAGLGATDIGYINAHGTSTPAGDVAETLAVKAVFGGRETAPPVSSTKSMTGHMLGAAGGVEAILTALALHHGVLPPTINLDDPDPTCDLDYVPHTAREIRVNAALSNSFGFGGTNATLVFQRHDADATS